MSTLKSNKKTLREEYRRRRDAFHRNLDSATRNLAFRRPPSPLACLIEQQQTIAIYAAVGSEAPTARLVEYLVEMEKTVCFPKVISDNLIEFRAVKSVDLLTSGYADIPEPNSDAVLVKPQIIIAPMVAFDRGMRRLGQGGGFYDRAFRKYPDALRIGIGWSVQEANQIPTEDHDVDLQMIITESEIIQMDNVTS